MATQEFDKNFQQLCTEMIEIAYEFVDYNMELFGKIGLKN